MLPYEECHHIRYFSANKMKILKHEDLTDIIRVKCTKTVIYLGVRLTKDRMEKAVIKREYIEKNIK